MKHIISMPTDAGGVVSIEVDDHLAAGPVMRGAPAGTVLEKSAQSFETAVATVRPVALAVVQQFSDLIAGVSSVRVTFGLKFSAEAGAIIASAGSEANFEIEVHWERGEPG